MADSRREGPTLESAWTGFGRSVAVAAGAAFALLSLLLHVPVWVAALRGGLLFLGLSVVVRATLWMLAAVRADAAVAEKTRAQGKGPGAEGS